MAKSRICLIPECNKNVIAKGLCTLHYQRRRNDVDMILPVAKTTPKATIDAFMGMVRSSDTDVCIIWPFNRVDGYACRANPNGSSRIPVILCEEFHGPKPTTGHQVAHRCGKGADGCVNPKHLRWATSKENNEDKIEHGTLVQGERQWKAKLTTSTVLQIRAAVAAGDTHRAVADRYGVSDSNIEFIVHRKTWKHVP